MQVEGEEDRAFPWLEAGLAASALALVFQLWPQLWWGLLSAVDVRTWTWRAYAVLCTVFIVMLVVLKAWQDR